MSWIPAEERIHADTCDVVMLPEMDLPCRCLVAHAAEADRRIAERDELIRELDDIVEQALEFISCDLSECAGNCSEGKFRADAIEVIRRVAAL